MTPSRPHFKLPAPAILDGPGKARVAPVEGRLIRLLPDDSNTRQSTTRVHHQMGEHLVPPPEGNESTSAGDATRFISEELRAGRPEAGERSASLIVIAGHEIGREYNLTETDMIIGRAEGATVHIPSRSVSRQHARILRISEDAEAAFLIEDLGSMNGTLVNEVAVTRSKLRNGDKIRVGEVLFKFVVQDPFDAEFHRAIHRLIHYDQLTGLMTMESFRRVLEDTVRLTPRNQPFTLAMTDLDGLKQVNDTYGHLAGRQVVAAMGAMMRATLRPSDRGGLYGGDEAIILYPKTPVTEAQQIAEQLRQTVEARVFEHSGHTFQVTISQGLAEWPRHGAKPEAIIAAADQALYAAKAAGRNCVRVASSERPDGV